MVAAIHDNFPQREIAEASFRYQQEVETGQRIVVGVNRYQLADEQLPPELLKIDPALEAKQIERVRSLKADATRPPSTPTRRPPRRGRPTRREPDAPDHRRRPRLRHPRRDLRRPPRRLGHLARDTRLLSGAPEPASRSPPALNPALNASRLYPSERGVGHDRRRGCAISWPPPGRRSGAPAMPRADRADGVAARQPRDPGVVHDSSGPPSRADNTGASFD